MNRVIPLFLILIARITTINSIMSKPKLVVFDLDYTLWPFWVDTHVDPPFIKKPNGDVEDFRGKKIKYYPEVPEVLKNLKDNGYTLAVASRTSEIDGANQLLELLNWNRFFTYKEIYPGSKVTHFNKFKKLSGLDFKDMLFFDDEERNTRELSSKGVTSILVRSGVNKKVVEDGLLEYSRQRCIRAVKNNCK